MRSVPKAVLLLAAVALPIAAVLVSFAVTDGPRTPHVPATVRIGSSAGPDPSHMPPVSTNPPAELPPPPPDDDDDDDDD
ncbi:hypothetical protein GCM10011581_19520 [Saccharopolyspora subtropica]|uniref:Small secreted hydrophilic protein n=1 Tax=Saccharopolyspora thermophila TaxID=89367 RepID=A0A917NA65_9PSEU|nr:hypothetical protein [Saccharopolyspora subtropica]GGI82204.1 hypothetical protein GCM10011581_19520 [Saccharopolyspora subtropica]